MTYWQPPKKICKAELSVLYWLTCPQETVGRDRDRSKTQRRNPEQCPPFLEPKVARTGWISLSRQPPPYAETETSVWCWWTEIVQTLCLASQVPVAGKGERKIKTWRASNQCRGHFVTSLLTTCRNVDSWSSSSKISLAESRKPICLASSQRHLI